MAKFEVDTTNVSAQSCAIISSFPDGNYITAGQNLDGSPCLVSTPDTMPKTIDGIAYNHHSKDLCIVDTFAQQVITRDSTAIHSYSAFDPNSQSIYNTSTHKAVTIETMVCNSSEICSSPEDNNTQNLTQKEHCNTVSDSYSLGILVGFLTSLITIGFCCSIYIICNSRPQRDEETEAPDLHAPELFPITHEADDGKFADG